VARLVGADAVAHGCTGQGHTTQVRFDRGDSPCPWARAQGAQPRRGVGYEPGGNDRLAGERFGMPAPVEQGQSTYSIDLNPASGASVEAAPSRIRQGWSPGRCFA